MIPRLYEKTETTFSGFGICPLVDAVSCFVNEERNDEYTLDLEYPRDGQWDDELLIDRIILADPHDNASEPEPFRITEIGYNMLGNIAVHAEHIGYQLKNIIVGKFSSFTRYPSKAWDNANNHLIGTSPFTFWTDIDDESDPVYPFKTDETTTLRKMLGGKEGSILDNYGGEIEWNRYTVKLWKARGADNGVKIAYTKNLTGLTYSIDLSGVYTGVVAFWTDGTNYCESALQTSVHSYAFDRNIVVDASSEFNDYASAQAGIDAWAAAYLAANAPDPAVSVDVEFVPLWQTEEYKDFYGLEHVGLCDTVKVLYPPLNLSIQAKVVKTLYNVLADRYESITISSIRPALADTIFTMMKEIEK